MIKHPFFEASIKRVLIVHRDKELTQTKAFQLKGWLEEKGLQVSTLLQKKDLLISSTSEKKENFNFDLVIVLGGDGTYLSAVRMLEGKSTPILGINMGSLGFLANIRIEDSFEILEMLFDKKLEKRPRSMLQVRVKREGKVRFEALALNDIVIERGSLSHLIHLSIKVEEKVVGHFKSDGVILSSPTGSTAYNLSAGGPILHPTVKAFVCTPICPHSLTNRPIIFPDDIKLSFSLESSSFTTTAAASTTTKTATTAMTAAIATNTTSSDSSVMYSSDEKINLNDSKAYLTIDGRSDVLLTFEDVVIVEKAPCYHYVLRDPRHDYFNLLREKLKFSEGS